MYVTSFENVFAFFCSGLTNMYTKIWRTTHFFIFFWDVYYRGRWLNKWHYTFSLSKEINSYLSLFNCSYEIIFAFNNSNNPDKNYKKKMRIHVLNVFIWLQLLWQWSNSTISNKIQFSSSTWICSVQSIKINTTYFEMWFYPRNWWWIKWNATALCISIDFTYQ